MILSLTEAAELKHEIAARFAATAHFHDGCGGQYFSLDTPESASRIAEFLRERGMTAAFSEDGLRFTVEKTQ